MTNSKTAHAWGWLFQVIEDEAGIPPGHVTGAGRTARVCEARRGAWLFLRDEKWSLPEIGRLFNRDHTTVLHALAKGQPLRGSLAHKVYRALIAEQKGRRKPPVIVEASTPPPALDQMRYVYSASFHKNPRHHYCIKPAAGGRVYASQRPALSKEMRALFGNLEPDIPHFFRQVKAPGYLGGVAIVPATRKDWIEASGGADA